MWYINLASMLKGTFLAPGKARTADCIQKQKMEKLGSSAFMHKIVGKKTVKNDNNPWF